MELVTRPRIICLGEAMREERVAPDGTLTMHYGGDTLNTAIHLARLGCDVAFATAVGRDADSDALVEAWKGEGLDTSLVARHPSRTVGRYRIAVDEQGERSFSYDRNQSAAREMFAVDRFLDSLAAIEDAQCFMFSLISLAILPHKGKEALFSLADEVRTKGGHVVFDGNYRAQLWSSPQVAAQWRDRAIKLATMGLPTLDDERDIGKQSDDAIDAEEVAARWHQLGCDETIVKTGAKGCRLPNGSEVPPIAQFDPVDTSGAGDAFNSGYLAARLAGAEPQSAAVKGNELAAWTIMRLGAIPSRDMAAPYRFAE